MASSANTSPTLHNLENNKTNYYSVLQCGPNATLDELKHNYRNLIKKFHPDKQTQEGTFYSDDQFIVIDKAFKTLSDEQLRKEYDAVLLENSFNDNSLVYAEINKSELEFDGERLAYFLCRCGQNIEISQDVLQEEECLVECSECTNCILIK